MDFLGRLKKFGISLFKKEGSIIGLDIGSSAVKLIELERRGGKTHLLSYGTLALGPYANDDPGKVARLSNEKLVEAITTLFTATGSKGRRGGVSIPLKLSLIVTIEVPESTEAKLATVVPLEARKYIPVPPSEVNIDWSVVSRPESRSLSQVKKEDAASSTGAPEKIRVLVAAIHNSTIESYQELAAKIHLSPALFEIETFSAIRAVLKEEHGTFALLDIGSEVSKIIIIDYGSINFSHMINRGSQALTNAVAEALHIPFKEAESVKRGGFSGVHEGISLAPILTPGVETIILEVKKVIDDFEHKEYKKIEKMICIGGGATIPGLATMAKNLLQKEVVLGDPFVGIDLPLSAPKVVERIREGGPEYAVAMGIALRALEEL